MAVNSPIRHWVFYEPATPCTPYPSGLNIRRVFADMEFERYLKETQQAWAGRKIGASNGNNNISYAKRKINGKGRAEVSAKESVQRKNGSL